MTVYLSRKNEKAIYMVCNATLCFLKNYVNKCHNQTHTNMVNKVQLHRAHIEKFKTKRLKPFLHFSFMCGRKKCLETLVGLTFKNLLE